MPVTAVCPNGHPLKLDDSFAGKKVRCPKCNAAVRIPAASQLAPDGEEWQESLKASPRGKRSQGGGTRRRKSVTPTWRQPLALVGAGLVAVVAIGLVWMLSRPPVRPPSDSAMPGGAATTAENTPPLTAVGADSAASGTSPAVPVSDSTAASQPVPRRTPVVDQRSSEQILKTMEQSKAAVLQRLQSLYADHYVPGQITPSDDVELKDGRKFSGKWLLFCGGYRLLITNEGRQVITSGVKSVTKIARPEAQQRPDLPDLDVTFIERTPRTRSNHGNVDYPGGLPKLKRPNDDRLYPRAGTPVTFTAHVVNRGARDTGEATCRWLLDGQPVGDGKIASLAPNAEATATVQWNWQDGPHEITFAVAPASGTREISVHNNRRTDRTDALGFLIHVTKESLDQYNSVRNIVDTFSFEDWVQHHFLAWNLMFQSSIHPQAPEGCLTRCRVDKIIYVNASSARQEVESAQTDGHDWGNYYQGTWHFESSQKFAERMSRMEWPFLHEMGHQLGLIDEYKQDVSAEEVRLPASGPFVHLHHLHSNSNTMMGTDGPTLLSEHATVALNRQLDRPRGYYGDYQFEMPSRCTVRLLDRSGQPLSGAKLTCYGRFHKGRYSEEGKLASGTTNQNGEFTLPNQPAPEFVTEDGLFHLRPNMIGKMKVAGEDGSVLMVVERGGRAEWHFLEVSLANVAALLGREEYVFEVPTQFADVAAGPGPRNLKATFRKHNTVDIDFDPVAGAKEYRIYGKKDGEVPAKSPFTLLQSLSATGLDGFIVEEGKHMYMAVTAVDASGRESDWSNVAYVFPLRAVNRIAVAPDGTRYISDNHGRRIIRQRADGTVDNWRPWIPPHSPWKFAGVALVSTGEILATDPVSHSIRRFSPSGDHLKGHGTKGSGNGQFDTPLAIAVDDQGDVYVADLKNHRVQVLDAGLNWKASITEGLQKPQGLCRAGNRLYVADGGNRQVIVFEKGGDGWKTVQKLDGFKNPFDVAVNAADQIIVADRGTQAVTVLDSRGKPVRTFDKLGVVNGVAVAPDGSILATAEWNQVHELKLTASPPQQK